MVNFLPHNSNRQTSSQQQNDEVEYTQGERLDDPFEDHQIRQRAQQVAPQQVAPKEHTKKPSFLHWRKQKEREHTQEVEASRTVEMHSGETVPEDAAPTFVPEMEERITELFGEVPEVSPTQMHAAQMENTPAISQEDMWKPEPTHVAFPPDNLPTVPEVTQLEGPSSEDLAREFAQAVEEAQDMQAQREEPKEEEPPVEEYVEEQVQEPAAPQFPQLEKTDPDTLQTSDVQTTTPFGNTYDASDFSWPEYEKPLEFEQPEEAVAQADEPLVEPVVPDYIQEPEVMLEEPKQEEPQTVIEAAVEPVHIDDDIIDHRPDEDALMAELHQMDEATVKGKFSLNALKAKEAKGNKEVMVELLPDEILLSIKDLYGLRDMFYAALAMFAIVLVVFAGMNMYEKQLLANTSSREAEVAALDAQIANYSELQLNAEDVHERLLSIIEVMDNQVYWTPFFSVVEDNTLPSVYYSSITGSALSGSFTLEAQTVNFSHALNQLRAFEELPYVLSAEMNDLTPTYIASPEPELEEGEEEAPVVVSEEDALEGEPNFNAVTFTLTLEFDTTIFHKTVNEES